MQHKMKQWFAVLLALMMTFITLPATALAESVTPTEGTKAEQVQALIDGLPEAEEITAETRNDVQAQIDAIAEAMLNLTEEETAALDTARYDAAAAALQALDDPTGDNGMAVNADPDPEPGTLEQVQAMIDELPEAEEITAENRADVQAQIDAIDAAMLELTGDEAAALDAARYDAATAALLALDAPSALEQVQALIDALPDADTITADNRADVEAQLDAIDEAKQDLTDEELDELDVTRYLAAVEAILALDDMAGADVPKTIALERDIEYVDQNGGTQRCGSATTVESGTTVWNETWYVVSENVTISDRITVTGNVYLILKDGVTLTASQGITVGEDATLTIYGQKEGTGKLTATGGSEWQSGIGSGGQYDKCGAIKINGGTIEATGGGWGAGIGGMGANVEINGGKVTATGDLNAAGIGGVSDSEGAVTITINGGTIEAHGGSGGDGAGIGAGASSSCKVTITGGTIEAYGGEGGNEDRYGGPGIGAQDGDDSTVVISGGSVKAVGGKIKAGIRGDFSTGSGSGSGGEAVIVCNNSGIEDTSENGNDLSCLIYNSSTGEMSVYGNQTLTQDLSKQFSPATLSIEENATLTVDDGVNVTLTGESTIAKNGTLIDNGSITNEGIIANHGAINGDGNGTIDNKGNIKNYEKEDGSTIENVTITGNPICTYCKLTADNLNFSASTGYTPPEIPISISNNGEDLATIEKVESSFDGNFEMIGAQNKTVEATKTDTSWIIKPAADLPVGSYSGTITITYNGMEETSTAVTVTFTVSQKEIPTPTDNPPDTPADNPPDTLTDNPSDTPTGNPPDIPTDNPPDTPTSNHLNDIPKTGDESNLALWFSLMILSLLGITVTVLTPIIGKKKIVSTNGRHVRK